MEGICALFDYDGSWFPDLLEIKSVIDWIAREIARVGACRIVYCNYQSFSVLY